MNASRSKPAPIGGDTYLFASGDADNAHWLIDALQRSGTVVPVALDPAVLDERIAALGPQAVFLDFSKEQASAASLAHQRLRRDWPALALLATGSAAESVSVLSALRAGVEDFIDLSAAAEDAPATLQAVLERRRSQQVSARGRTVALLGARAGLGVTTLATSLSLLLQDAGNRVRGLHSDSASGAMAPTGRRGVALLDLGLPSRDGLLALDAQSSFSFVDGVRNLRRLDQTLLHTALAHHTSGMAVLPLPSSLTQVREISHAESVALIRRLADFFDFQVADLGGFSTTDFIAQTVQEADRSLIVCDQSLGGIVSTANLLRELQARGLEAGRFSLVVNKMDAGVGLPARDIAERLGLALAHVLPMRSTALLAAASRGEMLVRTARGDPYVQAVAGLARGLLREYAPAGSPALPEDSRWAAFKARVFGRRKDAKEG